MAVIIGVKGSFQNIAERKNKKCGAGKGGEK